MPRKLTARQRAAQRMLDGGGGSIAHADLSSMSREDLEAVVHTMAPGTFAAVEELTSQIGSSEKRIIQFMQDNLVLNEDDKTKDDKTEEEQRDNEQNTPEKQKSNRLGSSDDKQPEKKEEETQPEPEDKTEPEEKSDSAENTDIPEKESEEKTELKEKSDSAESTDNSEGSDSDSDTPPVGHDEIDEFLGADPGLFQYATWPLDTSPDSWRRVGELIYKENQKFILSAQARHLENLNNLAKLNTKNFDAEGRFLVTMLKAIDDYPTLTHAQTNMRLQVTCKLEFVMECQKRLNEIISRGSDRIMQRTPYHLEMIKRSCDQKAAMMIEIYEKKALRMIEIYAKKSLQNSC